MSRAVWDGFCARFDVYKDCVPLFETDRAHNVTVQARGSRRKPYLVRSQAMEQMVLSVTDQLVEEWESGSKRFDGMLYMMGWRRSGRFVPLYIGKTETKGRGDNLSANIKNLHRDKGKFARWGDNYQYHVGDLSACVLPGHEDDTRQTDKYRSWARCLFEDGTTRLREPVYFWATAWDGAQQGIWPGQGATSLSSLEYLLIGVAGEVSPDLLNREGVSRSPDRSSKRATVAAKGDAGVKKILYIDLDNTLVDFGRRIDGLDPIVTAKYENRLDEAPGIFALMPSIPGAIEAFKELSQLFDTYILSTAPWRNPSAWQHKVEWVHEHLGSDDASPAYKRLILSHHKNLNRGDFLVDDRPKNGAERFEGEWIHFNSEQFPDWAAVVAYLSTRA
jgi:5'-nucleotidase